MKKQYVVKQADLKSNLLTKRLAEELVNANIYIFTEPTIIYPGFNAQRAGVIGSVMANQSDGQLLIFFWKKPFFKNVYLCVICKIMAIILQIISVFIVTLFMGCGSQSDGSNNNSKKGALKHKATLIDTPRSFVRNYGVKDTNRLFAFVGEKISVEPLPHERGSMDNSFKAKYVILKRVYGNFPEDTIEFVAYDHYGHRLFQNSKMFFCMFQPTVECTIIKSTCTTTFTKLKMEVGPARLQEMIMNIHTISPRKSNP